MNILNTIEINLSPNIIEIAGRVLSWHGFFTFVAVALAVFLVARWSKKEGLNVDAVYSVAVWTIIGGIVGARLVHVIDFWDEVYQHKPIEVFYLWNGGIAIFGAILGGFIGGASYILVRNSNWSSSNSGEGTSVSLGSLTEPLSPASATWRTSLLLPC